tara:strand:+ start:3971 stop:4243 length:273 start_codon:yes stop_codon:yes gene_type:complete
MTMYPDDWARKKDPTKDSRWSSVRGLRVKANILRGKISKNQKIIQNEGELTPENFQSLLLIVEEDSMELDKTNEIITNILKEINREKNEQ